MIIGVTLDDFYQQEQGIIGDVIFNNFAIINWS
jgi:hypothetical protein